MSSEQPSSQESYESLENSQTSNKDSPEGERDETINSDNNNSQSITEDTDSYNSVAYNEDMNVDFSKVIIFQDRAIDSYDRGPDAQETDSAVKQEVCESIETPATVVTTQETGSCDMSVGLNTQDSPAALTQERDTAELETVSQNLGLMSEATSQEIDCGNTPADNTDTTADNTDKTVDKTDTPADKTDRTVDKTDTPADKTDTPADKTDTPADKTDRTVDKTDTPADKTDTPADKTDTPADRADTPADNTERTADNTETPVDRIESPIETIEETADRTETPADNIDTPVRSMEETADKTERTTDRIEWPIETIEETADRTEETADRTPGGISSQDTDGEVDYGDSTLYLTTECTESLPAVFREQQRERRRDSELSEGEISDDSSPTPSSAPAVPPPSQGTGTAPGELVFEEGLSGITLSVGRLEEALLTPDSREEGEVDSDGELTSESEAGEKHLFRRDEVPKSPDGSLDQEDDMPACKFFLQDIRRDSVGEEEGKELEFQKYKPKHSLESADTDTVSMPPPFPPPLPFPPMFPPSIPPPFLPPLPPFAPFAPSIMPPMFPGLPLPPPALSKPSSPPAGSDPTDPDKPDGEQKGSADEKENEDEDKLQEHHWLRGLKTGRTAYTVANRRRELALTEPLEVIPDSSPELKPKKRWSRYKRPSHSSKLYAPGYSPQYSEDDPQFSAFANFTDIPDEIHSRSPRYMQAHSRSPGRRRYIGSPDSDHVWRHRRRRSSDRPVSRSRSRSDREGEEGSRSPLSHLTITSRSTSCSSTFIAPSSRPELAASPQQMEQGEKLRSHSTSTTSSSTSSSGSSSEASSGTSSPSEASSPASSQPGSPSLSHREGVSPLPKKLKLEKMVKISYGSDISDDEFGMSDEETGKKDSKKYKELSRDRPSISFSLGRAKLKRHSEFTTNKNRKMPTSSPEQEEETVMRKQDLPKKYEIIEAAKKEAREKKEQKLIKRKMKIAKMKFVKPNKAQREDNGTNDNKKQSVSDGNASFQHKIKVERVAPPDPVTIVPPPVVPVDTGAQLPPLEFPTRERLAEIGESIVKQDPIERPVHLDIPPQPQPPQVQLFTSVTTNRSNSDGKALSYKQKLLRSNLADTRRDDSHLKLDTLRNNRMGMKGHRGTNRGRGGKMIVNKDGSTTMVPFQREGQQLGGTVAAGGSKSTSSRSDSTSGKQKSAPGVRKHEHHSKKKDLAEWKDKLIKDLESINAQINEKAQDLT